MASTVKAPNSQPLPQQSPGDLATAAIRKSANALETYATRLDKYSKIAEQLPGLIMQWKERQDPQEKIDKVSPEDRKTFLSNETRIYRHFRTARDGLRNLESPSHLDAAQLASIKKMSTQFEENLYRLKVVGNLLAKTIHPNTAFCSGLSSYHWHTPAFDRALEELEKKGSQGAAEQEQWELAQTAVVDAPVSSTPIDDEKNGK